MTDTDLTWSTTVQPRILTFLARYPDAEWGAAHVILSDYNLEDAWFEDILQQLELQLTTPDGKLEWMTQSHSQEEIQATIDFLKELLTIPEDERCIPEDDE